MTKEKKIDKKKMKKKLLHCARRLIEKEHNTYVNEDANREDGVSQIYALILFGFLVELIWISHYLTHRCVGHTA